MLQQNLKIWKFVSETMASVLGRFSFTTTAEKHLKQQKYCKKSLLFGCRFGKSGVEIENYAPTQLNTLLQRSNAQIKNKHG